ncbi:MAG: HIT domain-containing protein [Pseudomonadota bacterium]|nr:MAG: HIT domain-containing protein [Pseudomonadota bacterium]
MISPFELHPRLATDTFTLGRFKLCRLLLMNDARFPWCILVPERSGITEIHTLSDEDQILLVRESSLLASRMTETFAADKMNVAALGNVVSQLHVHHVARFRTDVAWPAPVWGCGEPVAYDDGGLADARARIETALADDLGAAE